MQAERANPRRNLLPAGMLGMVVLIAAVEAMLARHELDVVTPEDWQYLQAGRDAATRTRDCDLLVLGDSLVKFGVLPRVVGRESRLRVYNLAVGGGQPPSSYALLRRALESGARPKAVVVDFSPCLMALRPQMGREHLPFHLGFGPAVRLAYDSRDPVFLADLLARRALISLRSRLSVRSWVCAALAGRSSRYGPVMGGTLRHWARNDGAMVMPAVPGQLVSGACQQRRFYRRGWTPDRVNADYVRKFFTLAEAHGVTVLWLIPPIHPAVQAANEAAGFDARYVAFVKEQQRRFPGLIVVDGRHANYDPDVFYDADHLGREGAFVLSEELGALIRSHAAPASQGRWVALPPYRRRPTDPAIVAAWPDVFRR